MGLRCLLGDLMIWTETATDKKAGMSRTELLDFLTRAGELFDDPDLIITVQTNWQGRVRQITAKEYTP